MAAEGNCLNFREELIVSIRLLRSCLLRSPFGENSHETHIYLHFHPFRDVYQYTSFTDVLVSTLPIIFFLATPLATIMNQYKLIPLAISPSRQNKQQITLLKVVPSRKILLHYCALGFIPKRSCSNTSGGFRVVLHIRR